MKISRRTAIQASAAVVVGASLPVMANDSKPSLVPIIVPRDLIAQSRQRAFSFEWDFCTCSGDTIKEKYENLVQVITRLSLLAGGCSKHGFHNIVGPPEILAMLEVSTQFEAVPNSQWIDPVAVSIDHKSVAVAGYVPSHLWPQYDMDELVDDEGNRIDRGQSTFAHTKFAMLKDYLYPTNELLLADKDFNWSVRVVVRNFLI